MTYNVLNWFPQKVGEIIVTVFLSLVGYFSPIKGVAHALLVLFIADIFFGYLRDRKLNKAKFRVSIIWEKTVPRMALVFVVILAAFMIDKETGQDWIHTPEVIGWFFGWLLIMSIAKNGYDLTRWGAFSLFGDFIKSRFKKETGIDINKDGDQ